MRSYRRKYIKSSVLDRHISVRDLIIYALYSVGALLLIAILIAVPFYLGRSSAVCDCAEPVITGAASVLQSTTNAYTNPVDDQENADLEIDRSENTDPYDQYAENFADDALETSDVESDEEETQPQILLDGFVELNLEDFEYELRGDDWGTINEVVVNIRNGKNNTLRMTNMNIKIYNVEDTPPAYWDEKIEFIGDDAKIGPGKNVTKTIPVHVSFSKLDTAKVVSFYIHDMGDKILKKDETIVI